MKLNIRITAAPLKINKKIGYIYSNNDMNFVDKSMIKSPGLVSQNNKV
jgi:hypothetical protein